MDGWGEDSGNPGLKISHLAILVCPGQVCTENCRQVNQPLMEGLGRV